jgi:hypothetical protein
MSSPKVRTFFFVCLIRLKELRSLARRALRKLTGRKPDGRALSQPRAIPKKIWIYWDKGEEASPPLVRASIASWRAQNPGWEVTVLDQDSAPAIGRLPMGPGEVPVQSYADLLRLRLLREYGGVWADATLYCLRPLDEWLPPLAQSGFFAYVWTPTDRWFILPNVLREMTNWFLAAAPQGEVISRWEGASFAYWEGRKRPHVYYWPHVLFEYLALTSSAFRRAAGRMPRVGAFGAHLVHDCVTGKTDVEHTRALLATGACPVQKLRWNWPDDRVARLREVLGDRPGLETLGLR